MKPAKPASKKIRAKKRGVTAVVVTLRPALLNSVDKVLILRSGRAEAFGSPKDVLHRLVRSQPGGGTPEPPRRIESPGPELEQHGRTV